MRCAAPRRFDLRISLDDTVWRQEETSHDHVMIPLSFLHVNYYTLLFFVVIDHTTSHFCLRRYPRCSLLIIDVHHTSPVHNLECQAANVRPCYLGLSAMCSLTHILAHERAHTRIHTCTDGQRLAHRSHRTVGPRRTLFRAHREQWW